MVNIYLNKENIELLKLWLDYSHLLCWYSHQVYTNNNYTIKAFFWCLYHFFSNMKQIPETKAWTKQLQAILNTNIKRCAWLSDTQQWNAAKQKDIIANTGVCCLLTVMLRDHTQCIRHKSNKNDNDLKMYVNIFKSHFVTSMPVLFTVLQVNGREQRCK
jgi:hypothetical protein